MKHVKFAFWVIIIGFLALLVFQNQDFFFTKTTLNMDYYFNVNKSPIPPVSNVILFAAFFSAGLLIAYMFSLLGSYKNKRTLKNLNATLQSQMKVISDLKDEIAAKESRIEQLTSQKSMQEPQADAAAVSEPMPAPEAAPAVPTKQDAPNDAAAIVEETDSEKAKEHS